MEHTLYLTIKVNVKSDLPIQDLIDELGSESDYLVSSSKNVDVLGTEWMDTSTQIPTV